MIFEDCAFLFLFFSISTNEKFPVNRYNTIDKNGEAMFKISQQNEDAPNLSLRTKTLLKDITCERILLNQYQ